MEKLVLLWLLALASPICGKGLLDLMGAQEIEGTWRASVNLPCVYEPSADFEQEAVSWKASQPDHTIRTIFRRTPDSGDQTLLTRFKGRIHVPKDPPGDVSLLIEDLEMADRGQYTCEVVWVARNKSRRTKETMTVLSIVKVAATKPIITAGSLGSILPRGRNISLTCQAKGSPPIIYRWFKAAQKGNADQVGENAILRFGSLQVSDTGTYFCEAENRVSSAVQRSDAFQLTVKDPSGLPTLRPSSENTNTTIAKRETAKWKVSTGTRASPLSTRRTTATKDLVPTALEPQRNEKVSERPAGNSAPQSLPLYVIALIAVLCIMVLLAVFAVVFCRRKSKADHTYEMSYSNPVTATREEASPAVDGTYRCEAEQVSPRVENNYTVEPSKVTEYVPMATNEYETLVHKMESEYEVVDTQQGAGVATWRPGQ